MVTIFDAHNPYRKNSVVVALSARNPEVAGSSPGGGGLCFFIFLYYLFSLLSSEIATSSL